jgi:O-acetyl-ADP-ribose deacetylase (regulator of RNase III)
MKIRHQIESAADKREVRPRIERALAALSDVQVLIFEPKGTLASDRMAHVREVPRMTAGRAALVGLINCYLGGLLDPFVTLLEVHKLMYFMQEAGEPLRLRYVKHRYGPYAENLRHVLHEIEGHLITGYADGGDVPDKHLSLVPGAVDEAKSFLDQHETSRARFERVTRLVEGFESSYGLELLSTVHWVMSREGASQHDSVVRQVHDWSARKRQFTPRQLAIAEERLKSQGWLPPESAAAH